MNIRIIHPQNSQTRQAGKGDFKITQQYLQSPSKVQGKSIEVGKDNKREITAPRTTTAWAVNER